MKDINTGGEQLKPGFTLMVDLREMKIPPVIVNPIHETAQATLVEAGLHRTAKIIPESDIVLKSVTQRISDQSKMKKQQFTDVKEAEVWLMS